MIPVVAASATLATGSLVGFFVWLSKYLIPKPSGGPSQAAPCTIAKGSETIINLPVNGQCTAERPLQLLYLNPCGNPNMSPDIAMFVPSVNANTDIYTSQMLADNKGTQFSFNSPAGIQTQYCTMGLSKNIGQLNNISYPVNTNQNFATVNMSPQCFTRDNTNTSFASALALPMFYSSDPTTNLDAWIIPGKSFAPINSNGINFPCTFDVNSSNTASITKTGLATELYLIFLKDTTFYMELTGAFGGSVNVFTNGVDQNGVPNNVEGYVGGEPGIVYGNFTARANDVIKFFLGSPGDDSTQWANPLEFTFNGNGQGGLGTMYGGTNGGGPSYAVHYPVSQFANSKATEQLYDGPLNAAISNLNGTLICVAGGGGGASRNASGGHAGLDNFNDKTSGLSLKYGTQNIAVTLDALGNVFTKVPKSVFGSAGSELFITGPSVALRQRSVNNLSGGGGVSSVGGQSNVPSPIARFACDGQSLKPFVGQSETSSGTGGGCATATDIGSGGGGGGGGLFGGGAGGYNGLSKPNNIHGAGGGGSSSFGQLQRNAFGPDGLGYYSLNKFRDLEWPILQPSTETPNQKYGNLVLGWPS
jgi:hypothetical protein